MSLKEKELYEFGEFRLDVAEHSLVRFETGERLPLTEKAFETLCVLVRNAGHLVNKNELMNEVWADSYVEENNLNKCVHAVRRALGDKDGERKFIETVKKHGFRFVAEVRRVEKDTLPFEHSSTLPESKQISIQKTSRHLGRSENNASGKVVALADWRREAETVRLEEAAPATAETESRPNPELTLAALPVAERHGNYLFIWISLVGLVVLAGFGLYRFIGAAKNLTEFPPLNIRRLTSTGKTKLAAVSPDGKFVAHVQQSGENQGLWVQQVVVEGESQIVASAKTDFRAVNFSPDGNSIYYITGKTDFRGTLFQIPTLGGRSKKISDDIYLPKLAVNGIGFAPGGKQIAFIRLSPPPNDTSLLIIADADGTNERVLISYKRPDLLYGTPAWSPDGETIVCPFQNNAGMNAMAIKVGNASSAAPILPTELSAVWQLVWQPDGENLLMVATDESETVLNQIYQVAYASGKRHRFNKDSNNYESVSLTADGQTIASVRTEQTTHLWLSPANDSTQLKQLTNGFEKYDGINGLSWQASGKISYESMPGGKPSVWQIEINGETKQIAAGGGYGATSPDGRFLVYQKSFVKDNRPAHGLFLFDTLDDSERQLTAGWDIWAEFTPDGKSIEFIRWGEDAAMATLRSVSIEGGEPVRLTNFLAITAAVSPDNKTIAVARWNGAKTQIVLIPAAGGEPTKTFDVDFNIQDRFGKRPIQWTADGRGINFIREIKGVSNIWRQSIDGGEPLPVTNFASSLIFNFAFSPDDSRLALSRGTINSDVILIVKSN